MEKLFYRILKAGEILTKRNEDKITKYGTEYGGWYLPRNLILLPHDICISAGAGEDLSFECELAEKFQGHIYIIDPTPRSIVHYKHLCVSVMEGHNFKINNQNDVFYKISADNLKKLNYFPYGLCDKTCKMKFYYPVNDEWVSCSINSEGKSEKFFEAECLKFTDFLKQNSITKENIRVVKMDIEGSEYGVIPDMIREKILPDALCFEIHESSKRPVYKLIYLFYLLKKAGMKLLYVTSQNILWVNNV